MPRLVTERVGTRHWKSRPCGDDRSALHSLVIDRRRRQIESDVRALFALLHSDENAVTDYDELFIALDQWIHRILEKTAVPVFLSYSTIEGVGIAVGRMNRKTG